MKAITWMHRFMIAGFLLWIVPACDDTLDELLDQELFIEDVDYTKTEDMFGVLLGAYGNFYMLEWETFPLIGVRGDDVHAAGDQFPLWEADEYRYDPNFWIVNSVWLNLYGDVFAFNAAVEEIEKYKGNVQNPGLAEQYAAEIKVMKGFEMIQLVRLWGEILIPETSLATELYDLPLSSPGETYQYISDLMDEALPHLPAVRPNQRTDIPGGITRYTALAVKALANLEIKNWQAVVDATGEIIESDLYSLEADYYNLFKTAGKLNDEILLELQYSDFGAGSGEAEYYLHAFFGPQNWTPSVAGIEGGWGFWEPTLKYIKFMLDRDEELRLQTSVIFTNAGIAGIESDPNYASLPGWITNSTPDGDVFNNYARALFASGKHYLPSNGYTPGRIRYGENKNFICIRYAEILLSHAEALTQGAVSTVMSADEAVNLVRDRAGLSSLSNVTLENVLDEKFAELAMEWGIRFYDLLRHNKTSELNYSEQGITYSYSDGKKFMDYPLAQQDLLTQLVND